MAFESTLPDRTTASGVQAHVDDHNTMHGMLQGRPIYNVMDYGSSNNAARVQAAIDAAATDGGGTVTLPPNQTFAFGTSTVNIDYANGAGYGAVNLIGAGHMASAITITTGPAFFFGSKEPGPLTNPRTMGILKGFSITGPVTAGNYTPGTTGITITQARYCLLEDIFINNAEVAFNFDCSPDGVTTTNTGCFGTGIECRKLRVLGCKYGYKLWDSGSPHSNPAWDEEWTDNHFINCYANSQDGSTLRAGTIGFYLLRANTNQFFGCSQEGFEVGFQLGAASGNQQTARNAFYYIRDEISGTVAASTWHESAIIYNGDDNAFFGSKGTVRDYSSLQGNLIMSKRDVNRSAALTTVHRAIRNLDSMWDNTGAITSPTKNLTTTNGVFQPADVGRNIWVQGAGTAGANLATTIAAYVSATAVTLTASSATTVSGARVLVQATLPPAAATQTGNILFEERMTGAADRLVFYSQDAADAAIRTDILTGTTF